MQNTRGWESRTARYGAVILGVSAIVAVWSVQPLGAQSLGLIKGHVPVEGGPPYTQQSVQARDIQTREIVATAEVDENTAEYELTSLPEGVYFVDLVDGDGGVLCSEGPFKIAGDQVLHEAQDLCGDRSPWFWRLLAVAAGATTTGFVVSGGTTPTTICHEGGTATVESEQIPEHLSHGDSLGACPASPSR